MTPTRDHVRRVAAADQLSAARRDLSPRRRQRLDKHADCGDRRRGSARRRASPTRSPQAQAPYKQRVDVEMRALLELLAASPAPAATAAWLLTVWSGGRP